MADFVRASDVLLHCHAASVTEALEILAKKAAELGVAADAATVLKAFEAREAEGTTGMVGGFAVPHAKSSAITRATVIVAKFDEPVSWESLDKAPIRCAISLLIPEGEAGTAHLKLLSKVAVMLMDEGFRQEVLAIDDAAQLAAAINARLEA